VPDLAAGSHRDVARPFAVTWSFGSDCIRTEAPESCFDAFSSREPVSTSLENALKRDEIGMNRHRALGYCLSMIFSEHRCTLFRIML
jgi:hypothetical protein